MFKFKKIKIEKFNSLLRSKTSQDYFKFQINVSQGHKVANFKPALTLTELLIGMAILAMVGLMVGGVYITHFRLFSNQNTSIDVASANRIALDEITNQIREASAVVATGTIVTACDAVTAQTSDADSLVITLWPLDPSGEPRVPTDTPQNDPTKSDRIIYCVDTTKKNLIKSTVPTTDGTTTRTAVTKILASNLATTNPTNGLAFTYYDDSNTITATPANMYEIKTRLKISAKNFNNSQTFDSDIEARAALRNK